MQGRGTDARFKSSNGISVVLFLANLSASMFVQHLLKSESDQAGWHVTTEECTL